MTLKSLTTLFAFLIALAFAVPAKADSVFQLGTIVKQQLKCQGGLQTLEIIWEFQSGPIISDILVNGKSEAAGSTAEALGDNGGAIIKKEGVYSITLTDQDTKEEFDKDVVIGSKTLAMHCTVSQTSAETFMDFFNRGTL